MNKATREALLQHQQLLSQKLEFKRESADELRSRLGQLEMSITATQAELAEIESDLDKDNGACKSIGVEAFLRGR